MADVRPQDASVDNMLEAILEHYRTALERGGVVQLRPNGNYRVRWREYDEQKGYLVHRSMALGSDPKEAREVSAILGRWKAEAQAAKADAKRRESDQARAERLAQAERRLHERFIALGVGGGRDEQRKTIRAMRLALNAGPIEAFKFAYGVENRKPTKPGRPRRMRIW